ncbi:MAG: hypothetical protein ABSE58_02630 [Candidatus Limnocylindrales bacterium]|jgi:hypothetical protein
MRPIDHDETYPTYERHDNEGRENAGHGLVSYRVTVPSGHPKGLLPPAAEVGEHPSEGLDPGDIFIDDGPDGSAPGVERPFLRW